MGILSLLKEIVILHPQKEVGYFVTFHRKKGLGFPALELLFCFALSPQKTGLVIPLQRVRI